MSHFWREKMALLTYKGWSSLKNGSNKFETRTESLPLERYVQLQGYDLGSSVCPRLHVSWTGETLVLFLPVSALARKLGCLVHGLCHQYC